MLETYFQAFETFLQSGNTASLHGFLETDANLAALQVYRNGYLKTCGDALASSYPVVKNLVGEDYFRVLAQGYVQMHPPIAGTLVGYGEHFPDFLRLRLDEHALPYLPAVATLDAAWLCCLFAEHTTALSAETLQTLGSKGGDLFSLQADPRPSTSVVELDYDLASIWIALREGKTPQSTLRLEQKQNRVMLWRREGRVHIKPLETGEAVFLTALMRGKTLGHAATEASQTDDALDISILFATLLDNQILQIR